MIAVTLVTQRAAAADTLSAADYRDIYAELRSKMSLRQFCALTGSRVSIAWWSKWEADADAELPRARRAELRAAVGLASLPPTIAEAVAGVDPDAAIYQIGAAPATRVALVGGDVGAVDLRVNGNCSVVSVSQSVSSVVTPVTRPRTHAATTTRTRVRPAYFRPALSRDPVRRIPQLERLLTLARAELGAG